MRHNSVTSNIVRGTTKLETKTELNNLNESKNNFIPINLTAITKDRKVNDQVSVKSINVEMLTLNYEELELNIGEICKLEVTVDSDNAVYDQVLFISTSEDILKVDKNGIVTAVNQGVAVVLVTVGEKTVACYVVVN